MSLLKFNQLPEPQRLQRILRVVPPRVFDHLASLPPTLAPQPYPSGHAPADARMQAVRLICKPHEGELHLRMPPHRIDGDYALSLDLLDLGGGQLELSFIVVNDLASPRYDIDRLEGDTTLLGTAGRNLHAEEAAMHAGLGPSQVRQGLRLMPELLPRLERFGRELGYVALQLRPLAYHTALFYERLGFGYLEGHVRMKAIERGFTRVEPSLSADLSAERGDGELMRKLDGRTPFRMPHLAHSARGRSWAIHDGILVDLDGDPTLEVVMYKVFGKREALCSAPSLDLPPIEMIEPGD